MTRKVRYTYKIRPGSQATAMLEAEWSRSRWVWNECVFQFREKHVSSLSQLDHMLTEARSATPWLRDGSAVVQQQVIRQFGVTMRRFFSGKGKVGKPKRKKSNENPSLNYTSCGFSIKNGRLHLAKGISVPVVWSRDLPSKPSSVRIYRDSVGDWFASFVVEIDEKNTPRNEDGAVGIDWGVKATATSSRLDGKFDLDFESLAKKHARNKAKYQRRMAMHRDAKDWEKYKKAKKKAAKEARRERRQRKERSRQWAHNVAKNNAIIAVEDFKPTFLFKSRMARKAADAALGQCKSELKEAVEKFGGEYIEVDPRYTTQDCHQCGARAKQPLRLNQRTFECWNCEYTGDRDRNAARNMLVRVGIDPGLYDGDRSCEMETEGNPSTPSCKQPDSRIPRL